MRPPGFRKTDSKSVNCHTCRFMGDDGMCEKFDWPVDPDDVCDEWAAQNSRRHMTDTRVVREPRVYSREAPFSFFRDQANAVHDTAAYRRLERHLQEVRHEIEARSPEGLRALREYRQHYRGEIETDAQLEAEIRAATSTTIQGFTTPQWIVSEYALYRGTQRAFADQCKRMPMPGVGLTIHVPRFTANASAGVLAEGVSVSNIEQDPTGADNLENVQSIVGQVTISQQLGDRTRNMPDGPSFDLVVYDQLRDAYDQSLNNYVIAKATSVGATVTGASSFSNNGLASLYADLALAREKLTDTSGVRLMPTHLFTTPDIYSYMSHQLDGSFRPIIVPSLAPGVPPGPVGDEHDYVASAWVQFTGSVVPGLLFWFVDPTIPPAGSISPLIVARMDKILLFESDPVVRAFPQTVANQLQIVAQYYAYACCVPRYPGATATILGSAYSTSLT